MEDKVEFKKKVLKAGKVKQKQVIDDLQEAIDRRQDVVQRNDSDMHDYFESTREEILEYVEYLYQQLDIARKEFDLLSRLRIEKPHDQVAIGSLVETDIKRFYVSVGLEEFEVEGTEFFGLSTRAPIYSAMMGKKKGEKFSFRGEDHEIKDLY